MCIQRRPSNRDSGQERHFESDVTYNKVFPVVLSIGHVFAVQTLGWAYDRVKQELKAKSTAGNMTDIEQRQLRLLDYPASKQFLIRVASDLREEISGRQMPDPQALEIKEEFIKPGGDVAVGAWTKVLKSILPSSSRICPPKSIKSCAPLSMLIPFRKQPKALLPARKSCKQALLTCESC